MIRGGECGVQCTVQCITGGEEDDMSSQVGEVQGGGNGVFMCPIQP